MAVRSHTPFNINIENELNKDQILCFRYSWQCLFIRVCQLFDISLFLKDEVSFSNALLSAPQQGAPEKFPIFEFE